jgi:hypothetical protein
MGAAARRWQIIVMASGAGKVELTLALLENLPTGGNERPVGDGDRHPLRQTAQIGGERQQVLALERQRRRPLMFDAAAIDALFEIDQPLLRRIECRVAGRDALHARFRLAVPVSAGFAASPAVRLHSDPPSSTDSMPGLALSSSCIERSSRLISS